METLFALWAGVVLGVSFLATPVKFRARSLPYGTALDVGRVTFRALSRVEWGLVFAALLALLVSGRGAWWQALAVGFVALLLLAQTAWLLPRLSARAQTIIDSQTKPPPTRLHPIYIATEAAKVCVLLVLAIVG